MKEFAFVGTLPASKSMLNRAFVVQSYFPDLHVRGMSQSDDVITMKAAVQQMLNFQPIDCGAAGTVLRFLALRASRITGEHHLYGTAALMRRPHDDLRKILNQLSVDVDMGADTIVIRSEGWRLKGDMLQVHATETSQFLSGVLLNSWLLDFDLPISISRKMVSQSYFYMTLQMLDHLGMKVTGEDGDFIIKANQRLCNDEIECEADLSSAFAVAAIAAVAGSARITNFPVNSLQGDSSFVGILKKMNVPIDFEAGCLTVKKATELHGVEVDLNSTPDLFPVLAAICALSSQRSVLRGAKQLQHKESHRIHLVSELLHCIGRGHDVFEDGIEIHAEAIKPPKHVIIFDPEEDHRMAMAAGILSKVGYMIRVETPEVVNKSFPEFWDILKS